MADTTEIEAQNFWVSCLHARLLEIDGVSGSDPYETVVELLPELKGIQHALALAQNALVLAHARVHSLTITGRLPSEVLLHVFTCLSECDPASSRIHEGTSIFYCKANDPHLGWIVATHVCRRWRYLALSTPRLWSNVGAPFALPWVNEMLVRSEQHPFTLSAHVGAEDDELYDLVLKALSPDHVWRMKGLHLAFEGQSSYMDKFWLRNVEPRTSQVVEALTHPAPALESLAFSHLALRTYDLRNIFGSNLPRLRRLCLHYCSGSLDVDLPGLENIVNFEITVNISAVSLTELQELPLLLKKMPRLENLVINDVNHSPHTTNGATFDPVPLPCLKSFYLKRANSWFHHAVVALLGKLRLPPTVRREFELYDRKDVDFRISMASALEQVVPPATAFDDAGDPAARLSPSAIELVCNVSNHAYDDPLFSFKARVDDDQPWSKPRFIINWTDHALDAPSVEVLFGAFELHAVTRLAFSLADFDESVCGALRDAFGRMPAVREIVMQGASIRPLLRLLANLGPTSPEAEDGQDVQQVFFPDLTALSIAEGDFAGAEVDDEGTDMALSDLLLKFIQRRAAMNVPLHFLKIAGCEGAEPLLAQLRCHVKDVRSVDY